MEEPPPIPTPEIQALLEALSARLHEGIPPGWGFTLLVFETDTAHPSVFYISSASRASTLRTLREFQDRLGDTAEERS